MTPRSSRRSGHVAEPEPPSLTWRCARLTTYFSLRTGPSVASLDDPDDRELRRPVASDIIVLGFGDYLVSETFKSISNGLRGARFNSVRLTTPAGALWYRLVVKTTVVFDPFESAVADDLELMGNPADGEWRVRSFRPAPPGWDEADFFRNTALGGIFVTEAAAPALAGLGDVVLHDASLGPHLWEGVFPRDDALLAEIRARH